MSDFFARLRQRKLVQWALAYIAFAFALLYHYLPDRRVVGISKLARVVDAYAHRLQIQEKLTAQIANTLQEVLQPRGVAVVIEAAHQCMTTRGVHKSDVTMVTSRMLGAFRDNGETRREFLSMIGRSSI